MEISSSLSLEGDRDSSKDAYVTHIDFNSPLSSSPTTVLKLSTSTCELLHYDLGDYPHRHAQLIPLATTVRDEIWDTNHVPYGWLVKGEPPSFASLPPIL
jgi:hypothetical protein